MADIILYHSIQCPYCVKVRNYLDKRGIAVVMKDRDESGNREELISIGGKAQVPCLIIDGKALYESNDIISWFENEYT